MTKKTRETPSDMQDALIFIDTCIFLDFYQAKGREGELAILTLIDNNQDRIITGEQVEMEYKKNRQRVILKECESFKTPQWSTLGVPAFLRKSQASQMIDNYRKEITKQAERIVHELKTVMKEPAKSDPVYQCLQRLFNMDSPYNLARKDECERLRNQIHALARKRYVLGYPPRKPQDTSCGDGVNWEWLIHCAAESSRNVIIVSRDGDYGTTVDRQSYINDWLLLEFKERVSRDRTVALADRLTDAFKMATVAVTQDQVKEEENIVASRELRSRWEEIRDILDWSRRREPRWEWEHAQESWNQLQTKDASSGKAQKS
jgi:polyhydroxyalkanoate synthesis regulator phasin